eukprot:11214987-Lingulodinium_polyedra.AAC.1
MRVDSDVAFVSEARSTQLLQFAEASAIRKSRGPPMIASNNRGSQINGGWMFSRRRPGADLGLFPARARPAAPRAALQE